MEQNSTLVAEQFLEKICEIDNNVKMAMLDNRIKSHVISDMSKSFENIVAYYPHLVEDIQKRIINYHKNKDLYEGKINDFVKLVWWYSSSLLDHEEDYWDVSGKYYGLRMNEVINMFLMARDYCGDK